MDVNRIVSEIDSEIARLQQIRNALAGFGGSSIASGRGRPKGSKNLAKAAVAKSAVTKKKKSGKRKLSPEGRKRIADAMRRRWAERRKEASK